MKQTNMQKILCWVWPIVFFAWSRPGQKVIKVKRWNVALIDERDGTRHTVQPMIWQTIQHKIWEFRHRNMPKGGEM